VKTEVLKQFDLDNKEYQVLERIQSQMQKKLDESRLRLDTQKTLLKENVLLLTGLIKLNGKDIQGCVERCSRRSKRGLARVIKAYAS
jgi:hypothetical protein